MEIIVEVLSRNGRVQDRVRVTSDTASIGRAYYNNIIIGDQYVCPCHLQLKYDAAEMHWLAIDISNKNGAFLVGDGPLRHSHRVVSGDEIDLGHTRIRLLLPDHEVAPTKRMPPGRLLVDYFGLPMIASALLFFTVSIFALDIYLGQGRIIQWQELVLQGLMLLAIPFGWACLWSLIGRVFVHDARFAYHLSVGSIMVLASHVISTTLEYFRFMFNAYNASEWLELMLDAGLSVCVLLAALSVTTNLIRRKRWLIANGLTFSLLGVSLLYGFVNANAYRTHSEAYELKPPFAMVKTPVTSAALIASLDDVVLTLDKHDDEEEDSTTPEGAAESPLEELGVQEEAGD